MLNLRNKEILKSPYSKSYYVVNKGETVDWGSKPEKSLRISDHWNFTTSENNDETHCRLSNTEEYNTDLKVCEYRLGVYYELNISADEVLEFIEKKLDKQRKNELKKIRKEARERKLKEKEKFLKYAKTNDFKNEAKYILNNLECIRTTEEIGRGRSRRYIGINQEIIYILKNLDIKYEILNDAPRGGRLGDYIKINKRSSNKIKKLLEGENNGR